MSRIPLVKSITVMHYLKIFEKEIENHLEICERVALPESIFGKEVVSIPQYVFTNYLKEVSQKLSHVRFTNLLIDGAHSIVKKLIDQLNGSYNVMFLKNHSLFNGLGTVRNGNEIWVEMESIGSCMGSGEVEIIDEMLAILFVHYCSMFAIGVNVTPKAYHLQNGDKQLLQRLRINSQVPQFLERPKTRILYTQHQDEIEALFNTLLPCEILSASQSVELAMEGYIGRRDLNIKEFCKIINVAPRTLQRHLKHENTSFRAIKEKSVISFAKHALQIYGLSVNQLSVQLGYSAPSQFIRVFKKHTGITPHQWRQSTNKLI